MTAVSVLFSLVFPLFISQQIHPVATVKIQTPIEVSIDQAGNIYFVTYNGMIVKYDPSLMEKSVFSSSNPNTTTLLEAWQGLRVFSFQQDLQQFRLINRNLSLQEEYNFPPELVGFAEIAFPATDNNVWVVDQRDLSLKKYDLTLQRIAIQTSLDKVLRSENPPVLHAKEYQNKLFISTKRNGILIFDNMGNYLKAYQHHDVSFFNFVGNELYFINGKTLTRLNLYKDEESTSELPSTDKWKFVLIKNDHIYLFSNSRLVLYQ